MTGEHATYYTITDEAFFVGTVALLNSLRLTGHKGELVALDCGLTPIQRERLAQHCRVEPARRESGHWGYPLKPFAWRPQETSIVVMIDSDILVTGSLDPLLRDAGLGRVALFVDLMALLPGLPNRSFPEWQDGLGLTCPIRPQPYLNCGLIAFSRAAWPHLLDRWRETCRLAANAAEQDNHRRLPWSENPFAFPEQDALNAILMSEVPPEAVVAYDYALAPITQRESVRIQDADRLRCANGDLNTLLLHHTSRPKPWEQRAWVWGRYPAFANLLPRVLFAGDVPLRLEQRDVVAWLRSGARGRTVRVGAAPVHEFLRLASLVIPTRIRASMSSALRRWTIGAAGE